MTPSPDQDRLGRAIQRMRHIEDAARVDFYVDTLKSEQPPRVAQQSAHDQRLLAMLHFDLWGRTKEFPELGAALQRLWQHPDIRDELAQLLEILGNTSERADHDPGIGSTNPLRVHQRYTRLEILAAMGVGSPAQPPAVREGVYYVQGVADLLFVTLQKDPARFKPTTRYHDYALSSHLFHWESQSTTSDTSPTGQRYIHHQELGTRVLLFVRESTHGVAGDSIPFLFLGPATYRDHTGSRPMAITWQLEYSMPADFLQEARAVA
jgi:hypothetical protein